TRTTAETEIVLVIARANIDPEARRSLLMEGAKPAEGRRAFSSHCNAVRVDDVEERPISLQGLRVEAFYGRPFSRSCAHASARLASNSASGVEFPAARHPCSALGESMASSRGLVVATLCSEG